MEETEAAILRFKATLRSPGCVHLVLESISPKAPFMLENRSGASCRYRQAGMPQLPFQLLPPWSAAGYAWQGPPTQQQHRKVRALIPPRKAMCCFRLCQACPPLQVSHSARPASCWEMSMQKAKDAARCRPPVHIVCATAWKPA